RALSSPKIAVWHGLSDGIPTSLTAHASRAGSKPSTSIQSWSIWPVAYQPLVAAIAHQLFRRISARTWNCDPCAWITGPAGKNFGFQLFVPAVYGAIEIQ